MDWQPIDTAPQDGTEIEVLIWVDDFRAGQSSGHWHPNASRFRWNGQSFESVPRMLEFGVKAYRPGCCVWKLPALLPPPPTV